MGSAGLERASLAAAMVAWLVVAAGVLVAVSLYAVRTTYRARRGVPFVHGLVPAPGAHRPAVAGKAWPGSLLPVPHAPASIALDGDTDDPGWLAPPGPARTGPFVTALGREGRPYSDARLLWGDAHLYVLLYAADVDVRSRADAFRITFSSTSATYAVRVSAGGFVEDEARNDHGVLDPAWRSGTHVAREIDGTLDDSNDADEEWSLELAIPFASLGMSGERGESIGFALKRCDAPAPEGATIPEVLQESPDAAAMNPRLAASGCGGWQGRLRLE